MCIMEYESTSDSRPRVLVLVACYNGGRWIRQQLESILGQEGVDVRILVRDDGSSDETLDEIKRFAADDDRVRLLPPSAPTGSASRNFLTLMREAAAEEAGFVAFADQDDIWHPAKLAKACDALRGQDSVGYSSATVATWPDGRTAVLRQSTAQTSADFLFEGAGQGCTFVLRANFYSQVRAFVMQRWALTGQVHYHDWMIYALARTWGRPWVFDSTPYISYRQHGGNDTGARATWHGVRKRFRLIRRGWYRSQLAAIAAVCAAAAPGNHIVAGWRSLLHASAGWRRRLRIAVFCLRAGRRRRMDNVVLTLAALAGWI